MTPARLWWKQWYRRLRIARREMKEATIGMMTYGTGAVRVDSDGRAHYVPVAEIRKEWLTP
jgi:hypothetical protein